MKYHYSVSSGMKYELIDKGMSTRKIEAYRLLLPYRKSRRPNVNETSDARRKFTP